MKSPFRLIYIISAFVIIIYSCSKNSSFEVEKDLPGDSYELDSTIVSAQIPEIKKLYQGLISQYNIPELDSTLLIDSTKYSVEINKLTYKTNLDGTEINASGLVCVPESPRSFPVLCFLNGTNTLHSKAPSNSISDSTFIKLNPLNIDGLSLVTTLASMGFVVVIPDYIGFGNSEEQVHPYLIKDITVSSVRDMLSAVLEYPERATFNITLNNDLYLMGYSQGAWAGVAVQRDIELNGLGSYKLVAGSFGAGPYDIETTADSLISTENLVQPYFFPYIINSYIEYDQISDNIKLNSIFKTPYDTIIPKVYNGEYSSSEINTALSNSRSELLQLDFLNNYPNTPYSSVQTAYQNNSIEAWKTEVPTRLFHSEADEIVPIEVTTGFTLEMILAGTDFKTLPPPSPFAGYTHTQATVPFGIETIRFFLAIKLGLIPQN